MDLSMPFNLFFYQVNDFGIYDYINYGLYLTFVRQKRSNGAPIATNHTHYETQEHVVENYIKFSHTIETNGELQKALKSYGPLQKVVEFPFLEPTPRCMILCHHVSLRNKVSVKLVMRNFTFLMAKKHIEKALPHCITTKHLHAMVQIWVCIFKICKMSCIPSVQASINEAPNW